MFILWWTDIFLVLSGKGTIREQYKNGLRNVWFFFSLVVLKYSIGNAINVLWHICPTWKLFERRNLETQLRNSNERCFPLPSTRFPSSRSAPHRTLLGNAVNTRLHNSTERRVSHMSDSRFVGETEGSSQLEFATGCWQICVCFPVFMLFCVHAETLQ
jgi:hypothetical protein